jgi:glycosyltransferase involved in cell wall biosynthesis
MPTVSVIIPNFNHARFLTQRIESVLEQSFSDYEMIILDDASTDDSISIINRYKHNRRIRCRENKRNSGSPFKQWNKGVKEAKGTYLWFAESDDWADKTFLGELVGVLDNNPDLGLVYCQSMAVNETGQMIDNCLAWTAHLDPKLWCNDFLMDGQLFCTKYLMFSNVIPNASAVLIRRKVWDAVGAVNEDMRLCGDWLQWARILSVSDVGFIARPLNFFRSHLDTSRNRLMATPIGIRERYQVLWYIARNFPASQNEIEKALSQLAVLWLSKIMKTSRNSETDKLRQAMVAYLSLKKHDSRLGQRMLKYLSARYAGMLVHRRRSHV